MIGLIVLLIFGEATPESWAVNQKKADEKTEEEMQPLNQTNKTNA